MVIPVYAVAPYGIRRHPLILSQRRQYKRLTWLQSPVLQCMFAPRPVLLRAYIFVRVTAPRCFPQAEGNTYVPPCYILITTWDVFLYEVYL